ncbi:MAG: hypothetical protein JWM48_1988 [Mycobacterium sp.]|nr:hypothetical protein [Mycobacterium sp.]MCW2745438.1 hypothetical protein [Mycobacterium sp.]
MGQRLDIGGRRTEEQVRERALRRRCREQLKTLGVLAPVRIEELCRLVGERRRRPLRLVAHTMPMPGPFGVWIASPSADYILYHRETSPAHQEHIILHEVGHMLAGHEPTGAADPLHCGPLPGGAGRRPCSCSYGRECEREAELFATIIAEWVSVIEPRRPPPATDPGLRRVRAVLGEPPGRL